MQIASNIKRLELTIQSEIHNLPCAEIIPPGRKAFFINS